jgi:Zn ribbon nucleic-acid-binding protein
MLLSKGIQTIRKPLTFILLCIIVLLGTDSVIQQKATIQPKKAEATYQFNPTGGSIVTGSNPTILGATAASTEGINMGDYRGALADDNLHFGITSTTGGYNAYLDLGEVELNGANKMIIQTELDFDATIPTTLVQICDWVSSTGVHNAADSECTGGGWRNLNLNDTVINTATPTVYDWEIYNGYWDAAATTKIDTPLANFVDGTVGVRIRYYSTTNATSLVHIDYLRAFAVVNPIYSASGATQISGGTPTGNYSMAILGGVGQTGSDDTRFQVPGTAGSISDFYLSFTDVKTYIGANTILVRGEYSCSAATGSHRPKIYNFTTEAWENLPSAAITCSATDATNGWAKNNVNIADYVSNGEVRVGWYTSVNGAHSIRLDKVHIMIGTTNTDGASEISFGSNSANSVANTRDLDMTGTTNTWSILSDDESNTQGFAQYGLDGDNDINVEEVTSANQNFDVTVPLNTAVAGVFFASRHMSGTAGTVQVAIKDYSGLTGVTGGWSNLGATGATTQVYSDNITVASVVATGGVAGLQNNPEDYVDTLNNQMNLKLRTTASGAIGSNSVAQWDFAMVSIQWVEDADHASATYQFNPTGGSIVTGSNPTILGATAASTEGINMGDYRGALADDNLHFGITSTTGGYNAYLDIGNVQLNGANKMIIQTELDLDATIPTTLVQICDWVSSTGVHSAADSECIGGGWRNLNLNDAVINTATPTAFDWEIYNGYWNTAATTTLDTPLTNFVDDNHKVRIRYYSTINTTSLVHIDYLRVFAVINPVYSASRAQQISGGTIVGDYSLATMGGAGQTGSDDARFRVPGTAGSIADFYLSFNNVETYTGANTILVRGEYSCSAATGSHTPKIYNFNTTSWENLPSAAIACSTTDATNAWAKNNVTISDYVSNGEVRIGWFTSVNGAHEIRLDRVYIMLGTTNTDGTSEISFGSNSANSITNTRDLDMTGTTNTWSILSADESNTQGFASYGLDGDNDINVEEAVAANANFDVTVPDNAAVAGVFFASRHLSGTGGTVQLTVKDYSGLTGITGGWSLLGATGATTQVYTDNITVGTVVATGGVAGLQNNPEDYVDTLNNKITTVLHSGILRW